MTVPMLMPDKMHSEAAKEKKKGRLPWERNSECKVLRDADGHQPSSCTAKKNNGRDLGDDDLGGGLPETSATVRSYRPPVSRTMARGGDEGAV